MKVSLIACGTYHNSFYQKIFIQNELDLLCEAHGQNLPYLLKIFFYGQYDVINVIFMFQLCLNCKKLGQLHRHDQGLFERYLMI
jgi:hypothetical protein